VRVCVVLPTYNEADNIESVVRRIRAALPNAEVLVVDDGSPDGTAAIAERVGEEIGNVEVLRRSGKLGLGSAYLTGFGYALERGFDVVVEMDADLSHSPEALPTLVTLIPAAADLVIGSRYVPGGTIPQWTRQREWLSRWGNRYAAAVLGLAINDSTSGFRAYSADALRSINLGAVRAEGYAFQVEMAYRVIRAGGRVVEAPIRFGHRASGTSKMSGKIVLEAMLLVTLWGIRDRVLRRPRPQRPLVEG
jgi:dolichol-phosphate mannosyltransferase